jgi:hypothetical protein
MITSTEEETLQVSVLPYRCSIAPFCCVVVVVVVVVVVAQPSSEVPEGLIYYSAFVELVLNMMAHRCAWEGDLRGNRRMVWVPS